MVVLISGASHTGKTVLAQKLVEKYKYPCMSVDLIKMGLIRSKNTRLTPEDDDKLEEYLWPIIKEIIKTAIENEQNLIVEGCYVPFDWKKDFAGEYLAHIRYYCLVMSRNYIENNFEQIKKYASAVEKRLADSDFNKERAIAENEKNLKLCEKYNCNYILIDKEYKINVDLDVIKESERLRFRYIKESDFSELCEMLKDPEVMYAWEHGFSNDEIYEWINKRRKGYEKNGYDYFLAIDKSSGAIVGQIGLLEEDVDEKTYAGVGYILKKEYWHKGYATEGAKAMIDYAFNDLKKDKVIATIRPENIFSRKVAQRLKMTVEGEFIKRYNEKDMCHLIYAKEKEDKI